MLYAWALLFCTALHAADTLTLGIFAFRPKAVMIEQYQPLVDYLNQQVRQPRIALQVLNQDEMESALAAGQLDLLFTNPSHYMVLRNRNQLSGALATLVRLENGQAVSTLGGVIITAAERNDIATLANLKGRRIAVPGTKYLGGYQAQAYELLQAGIHLPDDAQLHDVKSHDAVVRSVLAGEADAGFIRTTIIESMAAEGKLDPARLRIVNRQTPPGFPFLISTRAYPEWPFVALPHVDQRTVRRIAAALLALEGEHPVLRAASIGGFTLPADYLPVEELGRALRMPPFDNVPHFTWRDVWHKHRDWLIALGLALSLLSFSTLYILLLSRRAMQANQRFRRLFENVPEPILMIDEGRFIDCNPVAARILGYPDKRGLLGKGPAEISPPQQPDGSESASKADSAMRAALAGETRLPFEWVHLRADGSELFVEITLLPFDLGDRQVILVTWHDITARKRAEETLRQLNETLEERVRLEVQRNLDQERLLIQQSRLAAMGEMIGNIAHQWRQPLNALGLLLTNLKDAHDFHELDAALMDNQIGTGRRLIERMSSTIDDFRNFFKPNKVKEDFCIGESIDATLALIGHSLSSHGITIKVSGERELRGTGYPNEFFQVLLNVFGNAKDVLVEKATPGGRIEVSISSNGETAWISVRDNGGGIPAEILPKIFDPYFTTKEKGTGIGLYMSKMIMEHMSGNIEARNGEEGAEFILSLPRAAQ